MSDETRALLIAIALAIVTGLLILYAPFFAPIWR